MGTKIRGDQRGAGRPRLVGRWGLRLKLNAVILPALATIIVAMIVADYHHEFASVMAAHAIHATRAAAAPVVAAPIDPATTPEAAARSMLATHAVFGLLALLAVLATVNAALWLFVLRPLGRLREACARMTRGHWQQVMPHAGDEMGDAAEAFEDLGLALNALVGQALQAERLATMTLLARAASAHIEPQTAAIAASVGRLQAASAEPAREEAHIIAIACANIVAALRGLEHVFDASFRRTGGGERS